MIPRLCILGLDVITMKYLQILKQPFFWGILLVVLWRFGGTWASRLRELAADWRPQTVKIDPGRGLSRVEVRAHDGASMGAYQGSYALVIANSEYKNGWNQLPWVPSEASQLAETLRNDLGFNEVFVLNNASSASLKEKMSAFIATYGMKPEHRLLVFFSGHGYSRNKNTKGYIVPVDAPLPDANQAGFIEKAISMDQVAAWAREIEARHALFVFDSCFSGTVFAARGSSSTPHYIDQLTMTPVRQFITAGDKGEVPAQSLFTPAFVKGLKNGAADSDHDGYVTGTELGLYLRHEISARPELNRGQVPQFGTLPNPEYSQGDFVFPLATKAVVIAGDDTLLLRQETAFWEKLDIENCAQLGEYLEKYGKHPGTYKTIAQGQRQKLRCDSPYGNDGLHGPLKSGWQEPEMVYIQGGEFQMGSPKGETGREGDERQHPVSVGNFYLGKAEITVGEFRRFVAATGYKTNAEQNIDEQGCNTWDSANEEWRWILGTSWKSPGFDQKDDHAVVCVSWNDAKEYAAWLSRETGKKYRLPTEAEWEYAVRAGTETARYWGNGTEKACGYGNVRDETSSPEGWQWSDPKFPCEDGYWHTAPVGKFGANPWELRGMLGNAWEWTCSAYDEGYEGGERICDPEAETYVLRGGSWYSEPVVVRSANRFKYAPAYRYSNVGFRVAKDP